MSESAMARMKARARRRKEEGLPPYIPPVGRAGSVVVAVDPPGAWCFFGSEGIIAASHELTLERALGRFSSISRDINPHPTMKFYVGVVERPYGGGHGNIQTIITSAISTGFWIRQICWTTMRRWVPLAGQWRKWLGVTNADRAKAKEQAVAVAMKLASMSERPEVLTPMLIRQYGPARGEPLVDACEAVCMAAAAWLRYGMVEEGDIMHRYIVETELPYTGGVKLEATRTDGLRKKYGRIFKQRPAMVGDEWLEGIDTVLEEEDDAANTASPRRYARRQGKDVEGRPAPSVQGDAGLPGGGEEV